MTFSSHLLPNFILRPAFLLKTGADGSLVPLFLSGSQECPSCCIQSTMSSSGTCFYSSPAWPPPWSAVPALGQSDPASPGAFEPSVSLRLPVLLQSLVSITTLSALLCVAVPRVVSVPSHCTHFAPCPFSHLRRSCELKLSFLAPLTRFLLCLLLLKCWLWRRQSET